MAEELQYLIERIHKEAIEASETEAARIVSQAKEKAAALVRNAEAEAKARLEKADRDAQVFVERSTRTLEQAARDLLITVGQGVENILQDIIDEAVDSALTIEVLQNLLLEVAKAYAAQGGQEQRVELLIPEKDQQQIVKFFAEQYRQKLVHGIEIHTSRDVLKGFKVRVAEGQVEHQFTREAIAEALGQFLRPHLSEIVHRAAREAAGG